MLQNAEKRRISAPLETDSAGEPIELQQDADDDAFLVEDEPRTTMTTSGGGWKVHSSLVLGQVFFGLGSVIAALGLPSCNPLAFALARESCAGVLLLGADQLVSRRRAASIGEDGDRIIGTSSSTFFDPLRQHTVRFLLLGIMIFSNQAGNIAGIKLAGPVAAAVWQPSQPIITAAISMCMKSEPINWWRISGVALAFVGCAFMVILSGREPNGETGMSMQFIVGNFLFFINCSGTSLYVILSKKVLAVYTSLSVTAWSYIIASIFMALTALLVSSSDLMMSFLCPDCASAWNIPSGAFFALAYFILFNSVAGYGILTWANKYASGTLVIGYTVLQPVTAALTAVLLLGVGLYPRCSIDTHNGAVACLDPPGWGSVAGMVGVFAGLYLVIVTEPGDTSERYGAVATNDDDSGVALQLDTDESNLNEPHSE